MPLTLDANQPAMAPTRDMKREDLLMRIEQLEEQLARKHRPTADALTMKGSPLRVPLPSVLGIICSKKKQVPRRDGP